MFEFQDVGVEWLRSGYPRLYLGDEPGLGKTRQLLLAAEGSDTLVVAPAMLLEMWVDEAHKWTPGWTPALVSYSSLCGSEKGPRGGRVPLPVPASDYRRHWDTVVFDEAHYLKSHGANRAAWAGAGLKLAAYADRVWQASGTAIPNWASEIFNSAQLLHPGDSDYTSYWRWAEHWFNIWKPGWGGTKVGKLRKDRTWEAFHQTNLGDRFLMRTWDELEAQLPPLRHQTIEVDLTPAQRRFYVQLKKDFIADLPEMGEVIAWNSGGRAAKLAQATFGLEMFGDRGSAKLAAAKELLLGWAGHPAVLVTLHRRAAAITAAMCESIGREARVVTGEMAPAKRYQVAKRFQQGEADVLVATVDSIAEGLTLTRADRMIFLEKGWRPSRNTQVERRIWRISQDRPCLVVDLVARGTCDARMRRVLERKSDEQVRALRPREFAALL